MSADTKDVQEVLDGLFDLLVPKEITPKERKALAKKAGISEGTLRANIHRKTLNAATLVRLLLARGVSRKTLVDLPQTETSKLSDGEASWIKLGRELSETERIEFSALVGILRSKWRLKKPG